ncbi:MAG: Transcriptional regulator, MarR family [Solirubrobacterales bacterium]|jgi:DNA-binding MarR family transcriptional regulator|nr:Transcriptional regulator, MarR family [Solirubrobacterales bacterium]
MTSPPGDNQDDRRDGGVAFLLAQLGAHAAAAFAERVRPLGLTPPQAGVLRRLGEVPGQSQRGLADALGMHAPRLVALIDELEDRGLVVRDRDIDDRRNYAISLTDEGRGTLAELARVAREHELAIVAALDDDDRSQLLVLLRRLAEEQGLTPGVHPGFRRMGRPG